MAELIHSVNSFSSDWLDAIYAVIWQSTLLAIAVAAVLSILRHLSPALRCWAWRLVAIKLLIMPFWTVGVSVPQWSTLSSTRSGTVTTAPISRAASGAPHVADQRHGIEETPPMPVMATTPSPRFQIAWQTYAFAVWMAVIAIQLARLGWQRRRLHELLTAARPADEAILGVVRDAYRQLQLATTPEVWITDEESSPFVCRPMRPLLVLPKSLALSGGASQLRQIVLHELAHLQRADLFWCWIMHITRMVYWFHPVAHWVAFRESLERELACDELAMAHSGATAADYAQTLVDAATRVARSSMFRSAAAAQFDGGKGLRRS
jgi:beta-lactamase regulating signal transducer with metallopeptidase domain